MRDEAYQALLGHAAKDSTPMQVGSELSICFGVWVITSNYPKRAGHRRRRCRGLHTVRKGNREGSRNATNSSSVASPVSSKPELISIPMT